MPQFAEDYRQVLRVEAEKRKEVQAQKQNASEFGLDARNALDICALVLLSAVQFVSVGTFMVGCR